MMMRRLFGIAFLVLAMAATGAGRVRADVLGFASEVGGGLYSVDLTTGTATLIGNTGINLVEGLALSPTGVLFATDNGGTLYTLNKTTGAITSTIGSTGLGDVEGLAFAGNQLVATNFNSTTSLFAINTTTANATKIADTNPNVGVVRALTATSATTGFFLAGSTGSESLFSIDATGATVNLGAINPISLFAVALAADAGGTLYSLDSLGNAYTVSNTGNYTLIGSTGSHFFLDLTIATAVPEPSSLALCSIAGVLGLVIRFRRRKALV
jgi:hypothetical protein